MDGKNSGDLTTSIVTVALVALIALSFSVVPSYTSLGTSVLEFKGESAVNTANNSTTGVGGNQTNETGNATVGILPKVVLTASSISITTGGFIGNEARFQNGSAPYYYIWEFSTSKISNPAFPTSLSMYNETNGAFANLNVEAISSASGYVYCLWWYTAKDFRAYNYFNLTIRGNTIQAISGNYNGLVQNPSISNRLDKASFEATLPTLSSVPSSYYNSTIFLNLAVWVGLTNNYFSGNDAYAYLAQNGYMDSNYAYNDNSIGEYYSLFSESIAVTDFIIEWVIYNNFLNATYNGQQVYAKAGDNVYMQTSYDYTNYSVLYTWTDYTSNFVNANGQSLGISTLSEYNNYQQSAFQNFDNAPLPTFTDANYINEAPNYPNEYGYYGNLTQIPNFSPFTETGLAFADTAGNVYTVSIDYSTNQNGVQYGSTTYEFTMDNKSGNQTISSTYSGSPVSLTNSVAFS